MQRHSLKVGGDVGGYAEYNILEEVVEEDCVWGFGEDAGRDRSTNFPSTISRSYPS